MRPITGLIAALFTSLAMAVAPAHAQDGGAAAAPAATTQEPAKQQPDAIDIAGIPDRADADERFAEAIRLRSIAVGPITELRAQLDAIARSIERNIANLSTDELRTLPVVRLESLARHWQFNARRFGRWQDDMRRVVGPYAQDAAELAHRRSQWQATRTALGDQLPPALAGRIDSVVEQLRQAEDALAGPLEQQIALGRQANALDARIQAGQRAVAGAIDTIDRGLLRIDAPPLWAVRPTWSTEDGALSTLRDGFDIEARFAGEYSASSAGGRRLLLVFELLLLPLLLWLAIRNRRTLATAAEAGDAAARVLRRPLSTWLLLSMMASLALEPDAPLMLQQTAMLLALVPVLRLLPPEGRRLLDWWPYVASALYLLQRLAFLFLANSLMYRLYCVGLTLLALAATLWLLARAHRRGLPHRRLHQWLRLGAWAAAALFLLSLACNLLGNVSLAEMLTSGVIDSAYFGLVVYAGVNVLLALLQLLMARPGVNRLRMARERGAPLAQMLRRLLVLASACAWLLYSADRFRILRPLQAALSGVLSYKITLGEITITPGHMLVFVVAVFVSFWAAKAVRLVLREEVLVRMPLPRGVGNSIASLSYYAVLLLGVLVALSAAGLKITQLAFVAGALGVGIGFGLQNVVNNFVSGLILMFERPIQPGDVIEVDGVAGSVREIGMRATTIKTFDGADVVVPNGTLLSEKLTNWTLFDRHRRLEVMLGVAYGSDPAAVLALLEQTVKNAPDIAADPAPVVLFSGFGASSLDFSVRAWTYDYDRWVQVRSTLVLRLHAALAQAGIEIPFPQQDLHLRSIAPEVGAALRGAGTTGSGGADGAADTGAPAPG